MTTVHLKDSENFFVLFFPFPLNNIPYDVVAVSTLINVMLSKVDMIYVWLYAVCYVVMVVAKMYHYFSV